MALDTNIALGIKPVEQVNMLGQMGQMMQLRQAQQEYQDTNAMRDLAAQHGGDISNPNFLKAAGALNPKYAAALRKEVAATEGTQLKTSADRAQALSGGFAWLAQNPSIDNAANIVASWQSQGLIPDRVAKHYMDTFSADPSKIAFNADLGAKAAISSKDQMTDATSRANNAATVGASMYGHNVSAANSQRIDARERAKLQIVTGDNGFYTVSPFDPNSARPVGMAPPSPVTQPSVTNALANPATASTVVTAPVNSLLPTVQSQPGAPTVANAPVTQLRPPARTGYEYNDQGRQVKIPQVGIPEGVKLKPGERWSEEKQMVEQIPGSAAFIEQQRKHGADLGAIKTVETTTRWGKNRIDTILDPKNKSGFENNFGGFSAYATKEFSGDTARVKSELDSLKSDLKERGLQLFRSGGSIGAMTEKEWPIVENMIASLSPKLEADDARDILRKIKVKFDNIESLAAEKYNDQWQGTQYHKPVDTNRNAPVSGGDIDTTNKFLK
jgi:hypothetical protein